MKNLNALLRFIIYHAVALAITVLFMLYIVYTLQFMLPGDMMRATLGEQAAAAGELPLPPTFMEWVTGDSERTGILNGNWGDSFRMNRPVTELLSERLPTTVELVQYTLMIALPVGIVLGILMALLRRYLSDSPLSIAAHLALAIPVFVMGLLLLYQLGIQQRLFPMGGRCSPGMAEAECSERLWEYLTLPVASLAIFWSGAIALYVRDAIWHVARQENAPRLGIKHIFAGVLIFIPLSAGVILAGLLSQVVLIESVFAFPGWGRLLVDAGNSRDYPILIAIATQMALLCAGVYAAGSLIGGLFSFLFGIEPRGYSITHHPTLAAVLDGAPSMIETQPANGLQKLLRRIGTLAALIAVVFIIGVTVMGIMSSSGDAVMRQNLADNLQPPNATYPWGTDNIGRDLQARTLAAAWTGLKTAGSAALITLVVGGIMGIFGGIFDGVLGAILNFPINRYGNLLTLLPFVPFAVLVVSITGSGDILWLVLAVLGWQNIAPLVRAQIRAIRLGSDDATGLLAVLVYGFFWNLAAFLLWTSYLDFLGLGVTPPTPSLGGQISNSAQYLATAPHMVLPAMLMLTGLVFACYAVTARIAVSFDFLQPNTGEGVKSKRNATAEALFPDVNMENR